MPWVSSDETDESTGNGRCQDKGTAWRRLDCKKRRGRAIDASWIEMETPDEGWSRSPEHQVKAGGKPGDGKRTLGRRAIPDQ
ncbi:MAG: hypothetical protein JAY65_13910 [Candidatus Thiodiazotropha endolucinida]|nr:hypothetical protein [Candidatus Thiodiazotropha taylori]